MNIPNPMDVLRPLKPFFGPAAEEIGKMIADEVRLHRWSRQLKIIDRANRILQERNIDAKPIHLKVLVPLLDAASLEDEPDLEEMWAKLLASASENNAEKSFYFIATEILKNISTREAAALKWMHEKWSVRAGNTCEVFEKGVDVHMSGNLSPFEISEVLRILNVSFRDGSVMIDNLARLNLVEHEDGGFTDYKSSRLFFQNRIQLTQLAIRLMEACGAQNEHGSYK